MSEVYLSNYYLPTRKEDPADAEVSSHRLMVRAGMIRKLSSGVYSMLPLGLRVQARVNNIVREEMNRAGGMEVRLPIMQPRSLWEQTGRWSVYGPEMMRFKDRKDAEYGLGPTHEEVITDLIADEVDSYRDCPLIFYQIATKFRDEIRPRFGVMRSREFEMKDAYSFHADEDEARETYRKMETAYRRIFDRIGFNYRQVEAATGAIGGSLSHEFMVLAETGEDAVLSCTDCDYAANREKASGLVSESHPEAGEDVKELEEFPTPGVETIEDLLEIDPEASPERQVKTMVYMIDGRPTAFLLPGDYDLNETKIAEESGVEIEGMSPGEIYDAFGAHPGSLGAVNLSEASNEVQVWADLALKERYNLYTGANRDGYHYRGVKVERDLEIDRWCQVRLSKPGEGCPHCESGQLEEQRGIEVGHIFYLGDKYSSALKAEITTATGSSQPMIMGCYGIGTSRIIAAAIEQSHDEQGIIWPQSIAPFDLYILPISWQDERQREVSERLAEKFSNLGYEVLVDDRDVSAGVKFNDSELIGIPYRLTLGRSLENDEVELLIRSTGETEEVPLEDIVDRLKELKAQGE